MRLRLLPTLLQLTMLIVGALCVYGAEVSPDSLIREEAQGRFVINKTDLTPDEHLQKLTDSARNLHEDRRLLKVYITGSASPDGPKAFNEQLAKRRGEVAADYMRTQAHIPDSLILLRSMGENWNQFMGMCRRYLDPQLAAEVQVICEMTPDREQCKKRLKKVRNGELWSALAEKVLPHLRYAIIMIDALPPMKLAIPTIAAEPRIIGNIDIRLPEHTPVASLAVEQKEPWQRHLYIKTNVPAWFCSWLNAAIEIDLAPHWTAMIPVYYSGFDYFRVDQKFRTFAVVPEARWFPNRHNRGFFIGAHLGMAYYNVALRGDYRYQDHNGDTPALGGGLAVGFRHNFGKQKRWFMEYSIGAGVYSLDYDKFLNYKNGLLVGRDSRTFFGIDQAAVTIGYTFDLKRKKGGAK